MATATRTTPRPRRAAAARRRQLVAVAAVAVVLVGVVGWLATRGRGEPGPRLVPRTQLVLPAASDPFAFRPDRADAFAERAAAGQSHVLYEKSLGGIEGTAARVAAFRPLVEQAVAGTGLSADLVEAIVFLESAGRPDVIAGDDVENAAGLTQILAQTATGLLGMHVDVAASQRLTDRIAAARAAGDAAREQRLLAERRGVDDRFDPRKALAGTVRYLTLARDRFGREDLAVVSYHMGIGNLEGALRAYADRPDAPPIANVVADGDLSYARLYFDSSPLRHAAAYDRLARLGDDSSNYYWKVLAARDAMALYRGDRDELRRLAALNGAKASREEVLHPSGSTEVFEDPGALDDARFRGDVQALPTDAARVGFRIDPRMGERASDLDRQAALYRGLRPAALALLLQLAQTVRAVSGTDAPLDVTSTVRDGKYQELLVDAGEPATDAYSLHTTGYAFDVARRYASGRQAQAFQFALDRLQALGLIAWIRERDAIHVTVGPEAAPLVPLLLRRVPPSG